MIDGKLQFEGHVLVTGGLPNQSGSKKNRKKLLLQSMHYHYVHSWTLKDAEKPMMMMMMRMKRVQSLAWILCCF